MTGKDLRKTFALFALLVGAVAFGDQGILSNEEDLEIDRQLELLNKPAIKSFKTEHGDIIDCVDIYKQPAFSHPLLQNHTIQMKPSVIPKSTRGDASIEEESLQYFVNVSRCPERSVPIIRTTKEDLIAARQLKSWRSVRFTDNVEPNSIDIVGHHFAVLNYKSPALGAKSRMNLWSPSVKGDQFSVTSMWLAKGSRDQENSVQAGWGVVPKLRYGTRLFVFWTADGYGSTGCYNTLCPGFVQISPRIIPGHPLSPLSTYNGRQFEITVSIHQDSVTGNWLFMYGNTYVGYWPKALLPNLSGGADYVSWGGSVHSPASEPSPAMGSGHFPEEGFRKAAYINQIQVAHDTASGTPFVDPYDTELVIAADHPVCYSATHQFTQAGNWGHYIYYGGPGNCVFK